MATDGVLLVHDPPLIASVRSATEPTHTDPGPIIAEGDRLTLIVFVAEQPVGNV